MSYCRAYDRRHEVYMYHDVEGVIVCCGCRLGSKRCNLGHLHPPTSKFLQSAKFKLRTEAIAHLLKHKKAGHKFPMYAIRELERELETIGDEVEEAA